MSEPYCFCTISNSSFSILLYIPCIKLYLFPLCFHSKQITVAKFLGFFCRRLVWSFSGHEALKGYTRWCSMRKAKLSRKTLESRSLRLLDETCSKEWCFIRIMLCLYHCESWDYSKTKSISIRSFLKSSHQRRSWKCRKIH